MYDCSPSCWTDQQMWSALAGPRTHPTPRNHGSLRTQTRLQHRARVSEVGIYPPITGPNLLEARRRRPVRPNCSSRELRCRLGPGLERENPGSATHAGALNHSFSHASSHAPPALTGSWTCGAAGPGYPGAHPCPASRPWWSQGSPMLPS